MGKVIVSLCLSVHTPGVTYLGCGVWGWGIPTLAGEWGVLTLADGQRGDYLPWMGGTYLGWWMGVPQGRSPSHVRMGVPQGRYPPAKVDLPGQVRMGVPQGRYSPSNVGTPSSRTCYTAGGMPLAFTQDFLVFSSDFEQHISTKLFHDLYF